VEESWFGAARRSSAVPRVQRDVPSSVTARPRAIARDDVRARGAACHTGARPPFTAHGEGGRTAAGSAWSAPAWCYGRAMRDLHCRATRGPCTRSRRRTTGGGRRNEAAPIVESCTRSRASGPPCTRADAADIACARRARRQDSVVREHHEYCHSKRFAQRWIRASAPGPPGRRSRRPVRDGLPTLRRHGRCEVRAAGLPAPLL
jgi:hypothetical protein